MTRSAAPGAVIENVVVDESLRGRGLGKTLMAATPRAAWEAGFYKAMLMTGSRGTRSTAPTVSPPTPSRANLARLV